MDFSRRVNTTRICSKGSLHRICGKNYNESSVKGPTIKVINSDTGDSGELYLCKCGQNIFAAPGQSNMPPGAPSVNVVTYKKQIGHDKMLVVKQELDKPIVTLWVLFHAAMFIFFLLLALIIIQMVSLTVSKADEIMAVLCLLLFILIYFHPHYFLPFLIFDLGTRRERKDFDNGEFQIEQ